MFHVRCKLPNASNRINGLDFAPHPEGGVITVEPIEAAAAAMFKGIQGYSIIDADQPAPGTWVKGQGKADPPPAAPGGAEGGNGAAGGSAD